MIDLEDVLNYIDIGISDNTHNDQYILYIDIIHHYFLNLEGIDFRIRYEILKLCNLIITKLIDHENKNLRNNWIKLRNLIVPNLIEENRDLDDDDRYFKS